MAIASTIFPPCSSADSEGIAAMLGAINLENDTFTLMEYKEINLNPPVKVLCGNRDSSRE
jgi:hypothetical protein